MPYAALSTSNAEWSTATHRFRRKSASNSALGLNVGDIIIDGDDIYGDGVNVAARLEALADPGGIMVSRVVHDQVQDKLSFGFDDMGEQTVKNIARPVGVHRIQFERSDHPGKGGDGRNGA